MKRVLFWVFVAAQALVPVALAGLHEADLAFSRHVLLAVHPLDPRDPFRGQYVALRYEIGDRTDGLPDGSRAYVRLHREDGSDVWVAGDVASERPDGGSFIRGRVEGGRIAFGIERYYTSEAGARRYDRALARDRVYADVALGRGGRASLDRLLIR